MSRAVFDASVPWRAPRVPIAGLVRLQFATVEEFLIAKAVDLSQSGMFIAGADVTRAEVGDLLGLRFEVAGERVIEAVVRVARVVPPGGASPAGIGVAFVKLGREVEELLGEVVQARLSDAPGGSR